MSIEYSENIEFYNVNLTLDTTEWEPYFCSFFEKVNHDIQLSSTVKIVNRGEILHEINLDENSFDTINKYIIEILRTETDPEEICIKLQCQKCNSNRVLKIIDQEYFVEFLSTKNIKNQIKFIFNNIKEKYDFIFICNKLIDISDIYNYKSDSNILKNKSTALSESIVLELNNCYIEYLDELALKLFNAIELCDYLLNLRTIASLSVISRKCDINKLTFLFDGDKQFKTSQKDIDEKKESQQIIYDLYRWCYCDERYPTRISIFNHVISQHQHILDAFKKHIFDVLESNYKVYISDNFEQYIEVTSKITEFLYETTNKISDKISDNISSSRNIIILILSYFFTIIVFTGIDKGHIDNIFNFEISSLSSLFIIGGLLNLFWLRKDIISNTNLAEIQLNEMIDRYSNFIGDNDVKNIKKSKSLEKVKTESSKKGIYFSYNFILLALLILVWFLYSLQTPLNVFDAISHDISKSTTALLTTK